MSSQVNVCMWVGIAWSLVLTDARAKRELKLAAYAVQGNRVGSPGR